MIGSGEKLPLRDSCTSSIRARMAAWSASMRMISGSSRREELHAVVFQLRASFSPSLTVKADILLLVSWVERPLRLCSVRLRNPQRPREAKHDCAAPGTS